MGRNRGGPAPDSVAVNPRAAIALQKIFSSGPVRRGEKAKEWYNDLDLAPTFSKVDYEKFRKHCKKIHDDYFSSNQDKNDENGMLPILLI